MKWSKYNLYIPDVDSDKVLVFNTLWRNLYILHPLQGELFDPNKSPEEYGGPEILGQLREIGTIVEEGIDERLLFRSLSIQGRFDKSVLDIFVSFTSLCNFSCGYCYESYKDKGSIPGEKNYLTQPLWDRFLVFLKDRIRTDAVKNLAIVLFGGEPLMNYDVVLKAAHDLRSLASVNTKVRISLITNGSLLSKRAIEDLKEYIDSVQVTIDGYRDDHDARRPYKDGQGTFDDICENLRFAVQAMGNRVVLRINIDNDNCSRISSLLNYLKNEGFSDKIGGVSFSQIFPSQNELENIGSVVANPRIDASMMDLMLDLQRKAIDMGFRIPKNYIDGPCSITSPNSFAVDEQLRVYKCPGYLYQKPVGFINEGGKMIINSNFWYESITLDAKCAFDCIYGPICYGGCRWQAGGLDGIKCHKNVHDHFLKERVKIYAESLRKAKNL